MKKDYPSAIGREKNKAIAKKAVACALAVLAGVANAVFGGGGGMLIVPAMNGFLDLDEKNAHASAVAVILPLSVVSAMAFIMRGVWDLSMGVTVAVGATVGGFVGAVLLKKMPKSLLSILFYGVMIYAGVCFLR